jgi:hypothetical protein
VADLPAATAERIAKLLTERLDGLSPRASVALLQHALWTASPEEIVAISQFMPPELRPLMPRKHLN